MDETLIPTFEGPVCPVPLHHEEQVVMGHGSGDMALAFTTAYTVPQRASDPMPALAMVHAGLLDGLFEAAVEATEQAILNSLWFAEGVCGRDGHIRASLRSVWVDR